MAAKGKSNQKTRKSPRVHKHLFSLNEIEHKVFTKFLAKYKVTNKSKFIRESLMKAILKKFEEDAPTLFD